MLRKTVTLATLVTLSCLLTAQEGNATFFRRAALYPEGYAYSSYTPVYGYGSTYEYGTTPYTSGYYEPSYGLGYSNIGVGVGIYGGGYGGYGRGGYYGRGYEGRGYEGRGGYGGRGGYEGRGGGYGGGRRR